MYPSPTALETIRDKYLQKKMLREKGIAVADFMAVCDTTTLEEAIETLGIPGVLKARVGGYDGRGNVIIREKKEVMPAYESLRQQAQGLLLFEKYVPFSKELSVIAVRDINGKIVTYPVAENMHSNGILHKTILPARISETARSKAVTLAIHTIAAFETVGCVGIDQAAQAALVAAQIVSLSNLEQRAKIRTYRNIDESTIQPAWRNKIGLLIPCGIELHQKKYSDFEKLLLSFGITLEKKEIPAVNDAAHLRTVNYFETDGVRALVVLNDCDIPFVAGEISALTDLPVIGVLLSSNKVASAPLEQYPLARMLCYYKGEQPEIKPPARGYPVLGVAINGLQNAALLAARIIGVHDTEVRSQVNSHLEKMAQEVREKNVLFHTLGWKDYAKQMKQ